MELLLNNEILKKLVTDYTIQTNFNPGLQDLYTKEEEIYWGGTTQIYKPLHNVYRGYKLEHDEVRAKIPEKKLIETGKLINEKLDTFRGNQQDIIYEALIGSDIFVSMATGGGKTISFAVPALLTEGFTIVIVPLVSLKQDQIANLKSTGIAATSETTQIDKTHKLLYLSPEAFSAKVIKYFHTNKIKINRFVIDEAHTVSLWGRDFREHYIKLGFLRDAFPNVPITALTGSANTFIRNDIIKLLKMRDPTLFMTSFKRDNLHINVIPVPPNTRRVDMILEYIKKDLKDSDYKKAGIIYCTTAQTCDDLKAQLKIIAPSFPCESFYAKKDLKKRPEYFDLIKYYLLKKSTINFDNVDPNAYPELNIPYFDKKIKKKMDLLKLKKTTDVDLDALIAAFSKDQNAKDNQDDPENAQDVKSDTPKKKIRMKKTVTPEDQLANYLAKFGSKKKEKSEVNIKEVEELFKLGLEIYKLEHPPHNSPPLTKEQQAKLDDFNKILKEEKDVSDISKRSILDEWKKENGSIKVVICTIAFGMGIDKPNVEYVLHYNISKNIENYYQEIGRGGRSDKFQCTCTTFYNPIDMVRLTSFIVGNQNMPVKLKRLNIHRLIQMIDYSENKSECRFNYIIRYFNERPVTVCGKCDICLNAQYDRMLPPISLDQSTKNEIDDVNMIMDIYDKLSKEDADGVEKTLARRKKEAMIINQSQIPVANNILNIGQEDPDDGGPVEKIIDGMEQPFIEIPEQEAIKPIPKPNFIVSYKRLMNAIAKTTKISNVLYKINKCARSLIINEYFHILPKSEIKNGIFLIRSNKTIVNDTYNSKIINL
jgi:superfamily II DNA helicase RecQ